MRELLMNEKGWKTAIIQVEWIPIMDLQLKPHSLDLYQYLHNGLIIDNFFWRVCGIHFVN